MSHVWIDETAVAVAEEQASERWLAEYGAAHKRYCRRLYLLMAVCAAAYCLAGELRGAQVDTVPRAQLAVQSRALEELKPGEMACTYLGWRASREGHVWLRPTATAEMPCLPSVNHVLVTRLRNGGWLVRVKAPVPVNGWDEAYAGGWGWVKAERVEVVR